MRDDQDLNHALLRFLRQEAPELSPICRWLILGPYLSTNVLEEYSRPPTVRELVALKRVIERDGPRFHGILAGLMEASGKSPAVRVEVHLDRLLELDPALWSHPSHVLDRPFSDAAELLQACRLRLEAAVDGERQRLAGVEAKLARAVRIEEKARHRRAKRGGDGRSRLAG